MYFPSTINCMGNFKKCRYMGENLFSHDLQQPGYKCWGDQVGCSATIFRQMPEKWFSNDQEMFCVSKSNPCGQI